MKALDTLVSDDGNTPTVDGFFDDVRSPTAAEEAHSMPKPGQTDNHHTTSLEGDLKGTQQSDGTPPASAVNK